MPALGAGEAGPSAPCELRRAYAHELRWPVRSRDGRLAGDRTGDRAALRRARSDSRGDRLPAQRPRRGGRGRGAARGRGGAAARPGQRLLGPRRLRGGRAGAVRRRRPQRRDRGDPAGARDRGQALGLDGLCERARPPRARARARAGHAQGLVVRRHLEPRLDARARELRARRRLQGGARGGRPLPRGRARPARHPRKCRLRRGRRDKCARPLPEPRADDLRKPRADARGPAGRAARCRRRGVLPLLAGRRDGARPDARGGRRVFPPGLMEPTDSNLRAWEDAHRKLRRGGGRRGLPKRVRERLPDLDGRHVLHLTCGAGRETAALIGLGALVTGVDSSEETVRAARKRLPDAALVTADVQALPVELRRGRFDLAYSSWGTLALVSSLPSWAAGVAAALRKSGVLLAYDEHPVAACLDQMLHWHESYFDAWPVGAVAEALVGAGLQLERLEELPDPNRWGRREIRVPGDLVVVARKP